MKNFHEVSPLRILEKSVKGGSAAGIWGSSWPAQGLARPPA